MKTLFLSDLDGTLLNSNAELTEFTKKALNKLIDCGANFSVATARTFATVCDMFSGVNLQLPFILMNGVVTYDPVSRSNISVHTIDNSEAEKVLHCYEKHNKHPMLYFIHDEYILIKFTDFDNEHQKAYISQRDDLRRKVFLKCDDYNLSDDDKLIYIVGLDKFESSEPLYNEISQKTSLKSMFYRDNYTDCYFLETFNGEVSKSSGALELKRMLGFDRIIAFGDNLNDIPLFEIADEAYAVSNAHEQLKKIATGVIGSNDEDAVVKFMMERLGVNFE